MLNATFTDTAKSLRDLKTEISVLNDHELSISDLFLYHHKSALSEYAKLRPGSEPHINALLEYGEEIYAGDFREADEQFRTGVVASKHLCKLFLPNDLVLSSNLGLPCAFVLQEWPVVNATGHVRLK